MPAEEVHEIGRQGVATIKRWLEATTYIELPWDAYNHTLDCTVPHLAGMKIFDLHGHYLTGEKQHIIIECKKYTSPRGQFTEFQHFLAIAYSSTVKTIEELGGDWGHHFMWVTFHPFNLDNWSKLETHGQLRRALEAHPEYLDGRAIDADVLRAVADRITVLVFNPKQESLSLTRTELEQIRPILNRKGVSL